MDVCSATSWYGACDIIVVYVEVVKPSMDGWAIVIVTGTNPHEGIFASFVGNFLNIRGERSSL